MANLDPVALREAFGRYLTGVTVVTTTEPDGTPRGFTANSFTSVSLDPPLLLVCLANNASSFDAFAETDRFAVNILAQRQRPLAMAFARKTADKFAGLDWERGSLDLPIFPEVNAWFACRVSQRVPAGDHMILIGQVDDFATEDHNPLGYHAGGFVELDVAQRAVEAARHDELQVGALLERDGRILFIEDEAGDLRLPFGIGYGFDEPQAGSLADVLAGLGVSARLGFVYAVAEEAGKPSLLHVYYRGELEHEPEAEAARMIACDDIPWNRVATEQNRYLLRRFLRERSESRFGLYIGDMTGGVVHQNRNA
jgi:flavin reductase (DIM6/NTAB) family NADH-FMN oxidoreductase RutF